LINLITKFITKIKIKIEKVFLFLTGLFKTFFVKNLTNFSKSFTLYKYGEKYGVIELINIFKK